jgi:hypothetical protein
VWLSVSAGNACVHVLLLKFVLVYVSTYITGCFTVSLPACLPACPCFCLSESQGCIFDSLSVYLCSGTHMQTVPANIPGYSEAKMVMPLLGYAVMYGS